MNQDEILNTLREKRKRDNGAYYSKAQLERLANCKLRNKIEKLYAFGFLDIKIVSYIPLLRKYRIKEKYL